MQYARALSPFVPPLASRAQVATSRRGSSAAGISAIHSTVSAQQHAPAAAVRIVAVHALSPDRRRNVPRRSRSFQMTLGADLLSSRRQTNCHEVFQPCRDVANPARQFHRRVY